MNESTSVRYTILLPLALVLAACSIVYELLLAQTLALLAANTVTWYSLAIGIFLLAMGLGAFIYSKIKAKIAPFRFLFWTEVALTILGATVVAAVHVGHMFYGYLSLRGFEPSALFVFLSVPLVYGLLIGIFTGFELPILMDIAKKERDEHAVNPVLAFDYFGSLVGGIAFPVVLLSSFKVFEIGLIIASINLMVAIAILGVVLRKTTVRWVGGLVVSLVLLFGIVEAAFAKSEIHQYFLKKYYYYLSAGDTLGTLFARMPDYPEIFSVQSPYQRIDLVKDEIGSVDDPFIQAFSTKLRERPGTPKNNILFLNGDFQFNTLFEEVYHEFFAHVPIIARRKVPKRVLVMGGGDGFLIRELLKYKEIESILHIDLDPALIKASKTHPVLTNVNQRALHDPRVRTVLADGYFFARTSKKKFPAIYIDFPLPTDYNLSKLYSSEFYSFVRQRLTNDGFAVFDASGIGLLTLPDEAGDQYIVEGNDWPYYYHTIKKAGFEQIVPYVSTLGFNSEEAKNYLIRTRMVRTPLGRFARNSQEFNLLNEVALRQHLEDYVLSLQQGFIMMAKTPGVLGRRFVKFNTNLHVLNRKRFNASFRPIFPMDAMVNGEYVNSIMLPKFPNMPFWMPRTPW